MAVISWNPISHSELPVLWHHILRWLPWMKWELPSESPFVSMVLVLCPRGDEFRGKPEWVTMFCKEADRPQLLFHWFYMWLSGLILCKGGRQCRGAEGHPPHFGISLISWQGLQEEWSSKGQQVKVTSPFSGLPHALHGWGTVMMPNGRDKIGQILASVGQGRERGWMGLQLISNPDKLFIPPNLELAWFEDCLVSSISVWIVLQRIFNLYLL